MLKPFCFETSTVQHTVARRQTYLCLDRVCIHNVVGGFPMCSLLVPALAPAVYLSPSPFLSLPPLPTRRESMRARACEGM